MRKPDGVLRNLFVRLYGACFDVELHDHAKDFVLLRDRQASGRWEFIFIFSASRDVWVKEFDLGVDSSSFGMFFGNPEDHISFTLEHSDGSLEEGQSSRFYGINLDGVRLGHYRFILPYNSPRDASVLAEASGIALAAHEIRHELQQLGVIPRRRWYQKLPPFQDQQLTQTKRYSAASSAREFRRYLKMYGKRLIDDREMLAMEVDAISVQLRSSYAWTESRGMPLRERLKRIRDVIFSQSG